MIPTFGIFDLCVGSTDVIKPDQVFRAPSAPFTSLLTAPLNAGVGCGATVGKADGSCGSSAGASFQWTQKLGMAVGWVGICHSCYVGII